MIKFKLPLMAYILLTAIAFGTIWTAYESHVANFGVQAMAAAISDTHQSAQPRPEQSY